MAGIVRAFPIFINGEKVAEAMSSTEDRTVNAENQYGVDGVVAQSIGADEIKLDFDAIVPITGMTLSVSVDDLMGTPVSVGMIRNGVMMQSDGVLATSNYTSDSKSGKGTAKVSFIGGAPYFL